MQISPLHGVEREKSCSDLSRKWPNKQKPKENALSETSAFGKPLGFGNNSPPKKSPF